MRAGFERDEYLAIGQAVVSKLGGGGTQGNHFGVRRRVMRADRLVAARGHDFALAHHHRSYRHFTCARRQRGLLGCQAHEY